MQCALSDRYLHQTDSDGQTSAKEFPQFWELRSKFEAVIGNRTRREDGASRVFVEKTLLLILKIIFGVWMPDSNAPLSIPGGFTPLFRRLETIVPI